MAERNILQRKSSYRAENCQICDNHPRRRLYSSEIHVSFPNQNARNRSQKRQSRLYCRNCHSIQIFQPFFTVDKTDCRRNGRQQRQNFSCPESKESAVGAEKIQAYHYSNLHRNIACPITAFQNHGGNHRRKHDRKPHEKPHIGSRSQIQCHITEYKSACRSQSCRQPVGNPRCRKLGNHFLSPEQAENQQSNAESEKQAPKWCNTGIGELSNHISDTENGRLYQYKYVICHFTVFHLVINAPLSVKFRAVPFLLHFLLYLYCRDILYFPITV